jgi:hypothetical protein
MQMNMIEVIRTLILTSNDYSTVDSRQSQDPHQ